MQYRRRAFSENLDPDTNEPSGLPPEVFYTYRNGSTLRIQEQERVQRAQEEARQAAALQETQIASLVVRTAAEIADQGLELVAHSSVCTIS